LTTTDSQLLERARHYEAQALAEIYDRYAEAIYRYLYRYVGDAAQAEDLTSEVFVKLLQSLNTARAPRDRLPGWLYRVAHNLAMDWFRKGSKHVEMPLDAELATDIESPLAELERRQTHEQLRAALRQLTVAQQRVILLRFGEGFKLAEVARLMGKSEGAIKILQYRAVRRLRNLLDRQKGVS
jgi:RNA polymerase sigma-70 factor (ECF subfamily)